MSACLYRLKFIATVDGIKEFVVVITYSLKMP